MKILSCNTEFIEPLISYPYLITFLHLRPKKKKKKTVHAEVKIAIGKFNIEKW